MTHSKLQVRFDENAIDRIFRGLDTSHLPGASVGIAIGGRPVYRKGFGLASMELPATLTPQTRMRIYSMTKHFTCLAYLLLCEEGKAGIDDPVGKYLSDLHPIAHRVTVRQLMSNTSGLRDACEIRWFFSGIEGTVRARDLFALYRDIPDVNFEPGEAWCYNNGAFHILSAIIEKLSEQPLEEVFRERIFAPAGMHDTMLRRVDSTFVTNSATMHMVADGGGYERKYLPGELLGEGGIVSTVDDILRWLRHMANPVVGDARTWTLLGASQRLRDGAETGYGLGLFRRDYCGADTISHSGGGLGNNSQMIKVPAGDFDVVVLVNRHDIKAVDLAGGILSACLDVPPEVPRDETGRVSGVFCSPTTGRVVHLYVKDGKQMVLADGAEAWQLGMSDDQVFRPSQAHFSNIALCVRGDPSQPHSIHVEYFGQTDELLPVRLGSAPESKSISGNFRADAIGVQMTVVADAGTGQADTVGHFGSRRYRLERLSDSLWRMKSTDTTDWGGILAYDRDGTRVTLRTPRTWSVRFRRA
jgi:D-aminopeptidase